MNNKFCKALGAIVVAVLLLAPALALGEARFPIDRGAVTDDANVLSQEMVAQIQEFQSVAESRTGVKVRVAVVHFLDGLDAQAYASKLFTRWNMGEEDFLLLGAAGEDSYGIASGQEMKRSFSDNNAQLMLSSSGFGEQFKDQQYDAAFGKFFVAFGQMLGRQYSVDMGLDKLFTAYQSGASVAQVATPTPTSGSFL